MGLFRKRLRRKRMLRNQNYLWYLGIIVAIALVLITPLWVTLALAGSLLIFVGWKLYCQ